MTLNYTYNNVFETLRDVKQGYLGAVVYGRCRDGQKKGIACLLINDGMNEDEYHMFIKINEVNIVHSISCWAFSTDNIKRLYYYLMKESNIPLSANAQRDLDIIKNALGMNNLFD